MKRRTILKLFGLLPIVALFPNKVVKTLAGNEVPITPKNIDFGKDDFTVEFWSKSLPNGEWTHIAKVYSKDEVIEYKNGTEILRYVRKTDEFVDSSWPEHYVTNLKIRQTDWNLI